MDLPTRCERRGPLPAITSPSDQPDIVTRLRAAGCVFAEDEARLLSAEAGTPDELDTMVEQRVAGLPLEHVLGWADFCGLRLAIGPGVFVPRHRTEFLVRQAADVARPGAAVVDLCCGCGAVGAAVTAAVAGLELHAADLDPAAVRYARQNLPDAHVYQGDLFDALPTSLRGRVDVLVVNAPYVPTGAMGLLPPEARLHEPLMALDGGADGLDVHRRVAAESPGWLAPGGHLLIETSDQQAATAADVFTRSGLSVHVHTSTEFETTVVIGTRAAAVS